MGPAIGTAEAVPFQSTESVRLHLKHIAGISQAKFKCDCPAEWAYPT